MPNHNLFNASACFDKTISIYAFTAVLLHKVLSSLSICSLRGEHADTTAIAEHIYGDTAGCALRSALEMSALVRVTPDDESAFRQNESNYREKLMEKLGGPGLFDKARRLALRAAWATLDHSYVLLLLGIAGYKFVEWMYSEEGVAAKLRLTGTDAPIPPPPLPPQFSGQALTLATMDPALCPLCKKKRVNPAMAPSGYVFCYPCIYRHVEQHGECPITQMKCDLVSIVKIYDDARDP
ncbi:hypothetical protein ON010_g9207 [Phytophthora cinnamomi]|nr:hypothetical protein ON010_g9207 [Phytophthora cinnamomi]